MALVPISFSSAVRPGRPQRPAETLPVPGNPQAAPRRPEHSPGRIPIAEAPQQTEEADELVRKFDREVRESREYQILKPYLRDRHADEYEDKHPAAKTKEDEPAAALQQPPSAPPTPATAAAVSEVPNPETADRNAVRQGDPLALDLDGNGLQTTGIELGTRFDLDADGRIDQTSFVSGRDAFVALDRNGNGRIDDGRELFGDQDGHVNGFEALAVYDSNGDLRIDSSDPIYERLRLLRMNSDGSQQLTGLADAGVSAINLQYSNSATALNRYDSIAQTGSFTRSDGSEGQAGDLLLGYRNIV